MCNKVMGLDQWSIEVEGAKGFEVRSWVRVLPEAWSVHRRAR